jgi:hypothetical protein
MLHVCVISDVVSDVIGAALVQRYMYGYNTLCTVYIPYFQLRSHISSMVSSYYHY